MQREKGGQVKPSPGPWAWGNEVPSGDQSILDAKGMRVIDAVNEGPVCCENPDDGMLLALAPEMREMLLKLEWSDQTAGDSWCHECFNLREVGHVASDCRLAALLEKLR